MSQLIYRKNHTFKIVSYMKMKVIADLARSPSQGYQSVGTFLYLQILNMYISLKLDVLKWYFVVFRKSSYSVHIKYIRSTEKMYVCEKILAINIECSLYSNNHVTLHQKNGTQFLSCAQILLSMRQKN